MDEKQPNKNLVRIADKFPQWFAVFVAILYGSGFLCVFTFLDRFGIRENGGDFFRVKYIHAGILFLLFPVSILLPFLLSLSIKKTTDKLTKTVLTADKSQQKVNTLTVPISIVLSFLNMCAVFYIFILFIPPSFALSKQALFPWLFIVSILVPPVIDLLVDKCIVTHMSKYFSGGLKWVFLIAGIGTLDFFLFRGYGFKLWTIFYGSQLTPDGAIYYVIFMLLIPIIWWRTSTRCREIYATDKSDQKQMSQVLRTKREMWCAAFCVMFMIFFLAILSFAYRVYPYIPFAKGGGNYVDCPSVTLTFRSHFGILNTNTLNQALAVSNCYIIVEQSQTSLFLANKNDEGGPSKWAEMHKLPNIIEVSRDVVDRIIYSQP